MCSFQMTEIWAGGLRARWGASALTLDARASAHRGDLAGSDLEGCSRSQRRFATAVGDWVVSSDENWCRLQGSGVVVHCCNMTSGQVPPHSAYLEGGKQCRDRRVVVDGPTLFQQKAQTPEGNADMAEDIWEGTGDLPNTSR